MYFFWPFNLYATILTNNLNELKRTLLLLTVLYFLGPSLSLMQHVFCLKLLFALLLDLLEKSRVVTQAPMERSYHMFYQMTSNAFPKLKSKEYIRSYLPCTFRKTRHAWFPMILRTFQSNSNRVFPVWFTEV